MSSIHPMSLLNLLRIRPFGLSSKNRDGAVKILEICKYRYADIDIDNRYSCNRFASDIECLFTC